MNWPSLSDILFNLLTYAVLLYSVLLLLSYILIGLFSIGETRKYMQKNSFTDYRVLAASVHAPSVSILAPAYNEGKTIVENVKSLLSIFYANLEVIIINDGSKDDSLEKLIKAYDLEKKDLFVDRQITTKAIRGIYKSRNSVYNKLIVIDKENGGKADALNVGINVSSNKYLVCIDVDCVLEQDALLKMIKPFLEQTDKRVIATGGVVRIANSCVIEDGKLIKVKLADDYLPRMQILEYIRAFILGRMAWSRLNGLMLISGAFGAFDKEIAIKCGGYDHKTVGEDMELVVRMRRYMEERGEKYSVTYIPDPLCWTEAPASFTILGRQRNRWIRGTYETLKFHSVMFFNPKYRLLGMLSYPYWFFFELCAPVIEFSGFIFFCIFAWTGFLDWGFFFSFLIFIICFGYLYSAFAILMEVFTFNQYKRRIDILRLMLTGLTEPFYYHPFVVWSAIKGYLDLIKKKKGWGEMTRQGFAKKKPAQATAAGTASAASAQAAIATVPEITTDDPQWIMERRIVPAIGRFTSFISRSVTYYLSHALVLLLLILCTRVFETGLEIWKQGVPAQLGKIIATGFAKDLMFFLRTTLFLYPVFAFCYLLRKKLAHIFFILLSVLLVWIQLALSGYFVTTLVPLGAELWGYSLADIRQTIGAAGSIGVYTLLVPILAAALVVFLLIALPRKLKPGGWPAFFFLLILLAAGFTNGPELVNTWMPGQEYSNSLSLNKSWYFYDTGWKHFFPRQEETDIYADNYSGDYSTTDDDALLARMEYVDEKNYPFLHRTDSSKDVLSPFFNKTDTLPNIVIVLVEGLGRAFSGKGAYLGSFTPFIDSLAEKSLYWENFLSESGRTFSVLPALLGSLPFASNGFDELGEKMPAHLSLINLLQKNGYYSSFYYGGDAGFDNMRGYLERNRVNRLIDLSVFPASDYLRLPAENGFSRGYGDKELFRYFHATSGKEGKPALHVLLTVSTHNPFLINEQERYFHTFEQRMSALRFTENTKQQYRNYRYQYASILYADDALRDFMGAYSKRPDFRNTVFLFTGDHRMPEIPMRSKIDRYHVPLLIYSPLLKKAAKFSSLSTHFDITPSLLAWLQHSYSLQLPQTVSWMGNGMDTAKQFRNMHAYPIMQTKTELNDFLMGNYLLNGNDLFGINPDLSLYLSENPTKTGELKAAFARYQQRNALFMQTMKLVPDSLLQRYTNH